LKAKENFGIIKRLAIDENVDGKSIGGNEYKVKFFV
jgi:hypothetical protein